MVRPSLTHLRERERERERENEVKSVRSPVGPT
jgi:hypothetical protein